MRLATRTRNSGLLAAAALALVGASCALLLQTIAAAQETEGKTAPATRATPAGENKRGRSDSDDRVLAAGRRDRSFAGFMYLSGAGQEPVFIDLETQRLMTPPPDLLAPENKGKPIDQWVFPKPLKAWIQQSGIDLAVQTDGRSVTVMGFDLRAGESFPIHDRKSDASIAPAVAAVPADHSQWITLNLRLVWNTLSRRTPFVTREGGSGTFGFRVSGAYGPNTIHIDYQLSRGPDAKLTGQPGFSEPPLLRRLTSGLIVDVDDNKLRLEIPGESTQIDLLADQLIVREASQPELRAARLDVGSFEIDAGAGEVRIRGLQRATLRRVGNRVEIAIDKRVPGRYQRNPDKRVALAERLTLMPGLEISQADSLEWTTVKPSPELLKKQAEERRKRDEAGEALYAELAAKHGYRLAPGQYIKRIPPPFPEPRDEYWRVTRPDQFYYLSRDGGRGPGAVGYLWDGKTLHEGPANPQGTWNLSHVCNVLHKLNPQQISGPKNLLATPLPGDWVYREGMTGDILVAQLERILRQELKLPIHLEFREKEQEVYVARGTWHMTPLSDTRVRPGGVQVYGKELNFSRPGGSGHGGLTEFLDGVGEWIDARIVRDNVANPPQRLTWQYHLPPFTIGRRTTEDERHAARDPALVLHNVEVQTGLEFTKETRPVTTLFVEEKPL